MREFREYGWEVIVSENEDIIFFGVGKRENEEGRGEGRREEER